MNAKKKKQKQVEYSLKLLRNKYFSIACHSKHLIHIWNFLRKSCCTIELSKEIEFERKLVLLLPFLE